MQSRSAAPYNICAASEHRALAIDRPRPSTQIVDEPFQLDGISRKCTDAFAGTGTQFKSGRHFAAWLGLVPGEFSTGGKQHLLGITKRGNPYLRKLLIHGARACVLHLDRTKDHLGLWISQMEAKGIHRNKVTIDDFERLLLKSINYLNLTSNKARLRTEEMAKAGIGIVPAEIHRYYQRFRRGKAARSWTPEEVFDTFLPWKEVLCSRGRIKYEKAQYTSPQLIEIASSHAKLPVKRLLKVEIKRTVQNSWTLLCRGPDKKVFEIEMLDEDKRRFGSGSWKKLELANRDETLQEKANLQPRRARAAGKIKATQQEQVDSYERGRGNSYAGAVGITKTQAKQNGRASRASEFAEIERAVYLPSSDKHPTPANPPQGDDVEDMGDDPLAAAARRAEEAYLGTK